MDGTPFYLEKPELDSLEHYGTPRHSGRYPWGSGENPYQSYANFKGNVEMLRKKGLSEKEIAKSMDMSVARLRAKISIAEDELRKEKVAEVVRLKDKGYSNSAIAKRMGLPNESSVRSLLKPESERRANQTKEVIDILKREVEENKYIDVGAGIEKYLGDNISNQKMKNALEIMKEQGYKVSSVYQTQQGTGKKTRNLVLTKEDVPYGEIAANKDKFKIPNYRFEDNADAIKKLEPPKSISLDRVQIVYGDQGGKDKDGLIELRRGVDDISLGNALYAQVRIMVDDTHYMKGMAMYSDDLPDGVDIRFNSNKPSGTEIKGQTSDTSVLKPIKKGADPNNPFGATIKDDDDLIRAQRHYIDKDGKEQLSALNIVNEEGNWGEWAKSLSSQFLSKQRPSLIKSQLNEAYDLRKAEYDEINSLTNPIVKKKLMDSFAEDCDAAASHLKAASMPRQRSQVLLPLPDVKEDEIYAPNYNNGEKVVLIRYPHGGIFEIPELTVNNNNPKAKALMKRPNGEDASDAVGINPKTAEKLSGADFDGDSALVIPNNDGRIKVKETLEGLRDFSTDYYKLPDTAPSVDQAHGFYKQREMGKVSNLITDMTIKGAPWQDIEKAVKHSMVIIDAEKHHLDWKQSYIDNDIANLKIKWQGGENRGASTLISKAGSQAAPNERKLLTNPNKMTPEQRERYFNGEKIWEYTGDTHIDKNGKEVPNKAPRSTKMAEVDDAFSLSSGTIPETYYAQYANKLKAMANNARKVSLSSDSFKYEPSAKEAYSKEVKSLNDKLFIAEMNRPLERKAQLICNAKVRAYIKDNPDLDSDDIKKLRGRLLTEARVKVGAGKQHINITDEEWKAIQARAISKNTLTKILNNADMDRVRQLAMPKGSVGMSSGKVSRARSMLSSGRTTAEVAEALNVSVSTLQRALEQS